MPTSTKSAFSIKENLKSIFSRPADSLTALDGLRAISIIWVVIFHVYILTSLAISPDATRHLLQQTPWYLSWLWNGDKGVDIFFVMSGFLISGLLFREHQQTQRLDLKNFYIRRFLRLTPVYFFVLGIYILLGGSNAHNAWANALYINNFLPAKETAMTWTWSLAVEEQFYLIFPIFLLAIFFRSQQKTPWLAALLLLSFIINFAVYFSEPLLFNSDMKDIFNLDRSEKFDRYFDAIYVNLYTRFGPFICGIAASYYYFYHQQKLRTFFRGPASVVMISIGLVLTLFFAMAPSYQQDVLYSKFYQAIYITSNRTFFSIGITILLIAALLSAGPIGKSLNAILSMKFWVPIARLSYSIYIFHVFVVASLHLTLKVNMEARGMDIHLPDFNWLLLLVPASLLISILIAIPLYVFIEKPFMNLRSGFRPSLAPSRRETTPEELPQGLRQD